MMSSSTLTGARRSGQLEALDWPASHSDELLEASWLGRGRAVRGRELGLELALTAAFLACAGGLLALAPPTGSVHPICVGVVIAYALAARADFPVGAGHAVPTVLFLVPLFALAPAQLVPLLVFGGLALAAAVEAAAGRARFDQVVHSAGDAVHALGPALVLVPLAGGDGTTATPAVIALAFAAQLGFDFGSSSLHDLVVFGVRPRLHLRVLLQVWGVDVALAPLGLLAAAAAQVAPAAALAPLPLVALLGAMSADRSRRIAAAHDRLSALRRERRRLHDAVERIGDAFAASLDLEALLGVVTTAATEALQGEAGQCAAVDRSGTPPTSSAFAGAAEGHRPALELAGKRALASPGAPVAVERDGVHALACLIGSVAEPDASSPSPAAESSTRRSAICSRISVGRPPCRPRTPAATSSYAPPRRACAIRRSMTSSRGWRTGRCSPIVSPTPSDGGRETAEVWPCCSSISTGSSS
jgi:hypothetical protein